MKHIILISITYIFSFSQTNAQVFSPQLRNFSGISNIFYAYGFYQGNIYAGVANGQGTFYYNNGTFFRGNFIGGLPNGVGILVIPYQGYITGCWVNGNFVGPCKQITNPYQNTEQINKAVDEVQSNIPSSAPKETQVVAKKNYKVVEIDGNTQLGQSLLGNYVPKSNK